MAGEDLHAPQLLDFEVASALRGHLLAGKLSADRGSEAISDFADLEIVRHVMTPMLESMFDLRNNFTVYVAAYVVLAKGLGAPLVTTDHKHEEARRLGVEVEIFGGQDL